MKSEGKTDKKKREKFAKHMAQNDKQENKTVIKCNNFFLLSSLSYEVITWINMGYDHVITNLKQANLFSGRNSRVNSFIFNVVQSP